MTFLCYISTDAYVCILTIAPGSAQPGLLPWVIIEPRDLAANEGQRGVFHCAFQGCPRPDVVWYHNGRQLANDETGISVVSYVINAHPVGLTFSVLTIEAADDSYSGGYHCVGKNAVGEVPTKIATLEGTYIGISCVYIGPTCILDIAAH